MLLDLADRAEPHLRRPEQLEWIALLAAERDNILAALQFAADRGDAGSAVRLGAAMAMFWMIQGDHAEAARRLRSALSVERGGPVPGDAEAAALGGYAFNTVMSGGDARGDPLIRRRPERPERAAHPLAALIEPAAALLADDTAGGLAAIDRRMPEPGPWTRAALHLMRAMLNGNRGDMDAVHKDVAIAQDGFREAGDRAGLALSLTFTADTLTVAGRFTDAITTLEEAIGLLRELGRDDAGMQRVMLAVARARSGDVSGARGELAAMTAPGSGTPARHLVPALLALGDLARHCGSVDEAIGHYGAAGRELDRIPSFPQYRALLEAARAQVAIDRDAPDAARRHLRRSFGLAVDAPDMPIAAVTAYAAARLRAAADPRAAAELLGAASVLRGAADAHNPDVVMVARPLRRTLGDRAYRAAHDRGARLDVPGALALLDDQLRRR
ncbi:MAG: hypothetical protein FWJ90_07445 [Actinomadura sp.]